MKKVCYVFVLLGLFVLLSLIASACAPRMTAPPPQPPQTSQPTTQPQTPQQEPQQPASTPTPTTTASGCNKTPPGTPLTSISVGGLERTFISYIPATYDPKKSYPLIVAFHGRTNSNAQVREYFGLERAMPEAIILYPSGLKNGGSFTWADQGDDGNTLRDYVLFDELLRITSFYYCVNTSRVFVVGHSLGAYFANSVACARAGTVRAVASLAGGLQTFQCRSAVASLLLHNPNDNLVAISEGEKARDTFMTTDNVSRQGAAVGGVLGEFNCTWYSGNNPVVWCPHGFSTSYDGSYYPHTWPDKTAQAIAYFFSSLP
jgi:polyhydroxybutyrate depolymerase